MKKILVALLLTILPTVISAETIPNNTIGLSPGIIEVDMSVSDELVRDITLMRSPLTHDELYAVSIAGNTTNLAIHVPDNLILPSGQQQIEFPLTIRTTGAQLGTYDVIVTFTPTQATTTVTNAPSTSAQTIAIGIATKIHITVVDPLQPTVALIATTPTKNQNTSQPYWLWLGGGILFLVSIGSCLWYLHRQR